MGLASPADSIDARAHTLRVIRESVHNTSRGSNFGMGSGPTKLGRSVGGLIDRGGGGGGDGRNKNSPFPTGDYTSAGPITTVIRNPTQGSGGGGGDNAAGGPVRFGGKKMEAKGLRRRAQAIRGALLRRGGSEKSKKGSPPPLEGVTETVDGEGSVRGGVKDPPGAVEGDTARKMRGGDSGRMHHFQLRKPGERGGRISTGAVAPTSANNDLLTANREGKVAFATRRPGPGAGGRPTGLITGAVTPWDSGANAREKLTSSSSFSGDDESDSEATVHQRDEGSNGPHFFTTR